MWSSLLSCTDCDIPGDRQRARLFDIEIVYQDLVIVAIVNDGGTGASSYNRGICHVTSSSHFAAIFCSMKYHRQQGEI